MSLLEQDITRKWRVDNKALPEPEKKLKFEARSNKEYEVKAIINSAGYGQQANNQIPGLYYLVLWKGYLEEENTWKTSSAVIHLRKLISTFHKEHLEKPIATFPPLDFAPPMARPTVPKQEPKQKRGRSSKGANKRDKKQLCHSWPQTWMSCSSLWSNLSSLSSIKSAPGFPPRFPS